MRKRVLCLLTAVCLAAVLGGCARNSGEELQPLQTLAPATVRWTAPDGDRVVREAGEYTIYIPERNQQKLGIRKVRLEETDLKETVGELVRRVLAEANSNGALRVDRDLELHRDLPVEISNGVCTVTLSSSVTASAAVIASLSSVRSALAHSARAA